MKGLLVATIAASAIQAATPYRDGTYASKIFHEDRHYRVFLPPSYSNSDRRYPVIYYFHGHSDRYTLEAYDHGQDTVPKIAAFVAVHPVIVVAPDGFVASHYTKFYEGDPYDVRRDGGDFDFGEAFVEFQEYIDRHYRTWTTRRFRATAGLSMGGFMSLYLSARLPDRIGSASAFNPGPEFYVGEKGRRSLWRPKDHVLNHEHTMIRLVRASGDYISQYHEETRLAYAITESVPFEFRQDEYHRHWATSIGETFEFHLRAFDAAALDRRPDEWNYSSAYTKFSAHGYRVESDAREAGLVYLQHVSLSGFGVQTRRWAPDGPPMTCSSMTVQTDAQYRPEATYQVQDFASATGKTRTYEVAADQTGHLNFVTDCAEHQIGISGPGIATARPTLLALTGKDMLRLPPGRLLQVPVRLFNGNGTPLKKVAVELRSAYPTVDVLDGKSEVAELGAGEVVDLSNRFQIRLTAGDGDFERARLTVTVRSGQGTPESFDFDVMIEPERIAQPEEMAILDGRTITVPVFRQRGNQGGGSSVERTVTEGRGNGNGIWEPGEQATVWVKVRQGLDPFDKNNWRRAKVYSDSPWISEVDDIEEQKGLEWTSAQNRTSLLELSSETPAATEIPLILDTEGWSFRYTPDVRYGVEPLYQAFQIHNHQLFAWTWSGK